MSAMLSLFCSSSRSTAKPRIVDSNGCGTSRKLRSTTSDMAIVVTSLFMPTPKEVGDLLGIVLLPRDFHACRTLLTHSIDEPRHKHPACFHPRNACRVSFPVEPIRPGVGDGLRITPLANINKNAVAHAAP